MHTDRKLISLHGGHWNGISIEDSGTVVVKLGIASAYEDTPNGRRPLVGARVGHAIYEFASRYARDEAFFLSNHWEGICEGIQEVGDE
jgi:hypothetical protein